MGDVAIDVSSDISGFFREAVDTAVQSRGIDATPAATTYLAALLADYAKPNQLNEETLNRPLTLLLDEAMQATGHERFERLRTLGDGVLYVSGFFGEHLENRGVEVSYVSALGARAYGNAAGMLRRGGGNTGPRVFEELAANFRSFIALLNEVADRLLATSATSDGSVLKLYERWVKTGSSSLADELAALGVVPTRGNGTVH